MVNTEKDAKDAAEKKQVSVYKELVPYAAGMLSDNTKISKEKMIRSLHISVLGLTKNGMGRPMEDLKIFLIQANQYGLNPFKKEIYATYVWDSNRQRDELVPIVSIHGLRKLARSSVSPRYAYTGTAVVETDTEGNIVSATVPVWGTFSDGKPFELTSYTALYTEFVRLKKDGKPNKIWSEKPRMMLIKCAEANAIRQAFNISGLFIEEEIASNSVVEGEVIEE